MNYMVLKLENKKVIGNIDMQNNVYLIGSNEDIERLGLISYDSSSIVI